MPDPTPHWELWGNYATEKIAEDVFHRQISKRGLTAWTWWGPRTEAVKMLDDPTYGMESLVEEEIT